jgi:hypothetical protein
MNIKTLSDAWDPYGNASLYVSTLRQLKQKKEKQTDCQHWPMENRDLPNLIYSKN